MLYPAELRGRRRFPPFLRVQAERQVGTKRSQKEHGGHAVSQFESHSMSKLSGKFIIDPKSGCWTWTGPVNNNGYGRTGGQYAHRIAYTEANGEIPPGLTIDHLCRNRRCVNPDHLEAVTHLENVRRKPGLATETHCRNGHRWTEATLYVATGGRRRCRKCRLETLARVTDRRRLTVEQVALIREARATGAKGREIADLAKVSMRTVWRVLNGQLGHGGFA